MRCATVFLFALLAYSVAGAQTLDKFYIGAFWVAGNAVEDDTIRQPNPGPVATYNSNPLVSSDLPRSRFEELQDLGLNLAGIAFDPNVIVRSDDNGQRNVLRDVINDLVATFTTANPETDIDVCVFDWGIHDASQFNRVILNPESRWDFEYRTVDSVSHSDFSNFPFRHLNLDRSILEQQQPYNCVRFTQATDTVRSLRFQRKRELTARKTYWGNDQLHPNPSRTSNLIAGLYHLSVILADDGDDFNNDPVNSTDTVLTIRITSTDPMDTSNRVSRDYVVPGNAFYDPGDPTPRPEPFEYHLGQIEIRIDSFYVRTIDTTEDAWRGCKLTVNDSIPASTANWERTDALVAEQLKYWEDLWYRNLLGNFEIEIIGNSNAHFFVDAVCLSSPAAYGLFASNDVHAGVHSGVHDDVMTRLSAIVSDRNGVGLAPTARMPLITMKEQSPSSGSWTSERVVSAALTDSLPGCLPYSAHGAEVSAEDLGPLLEFQRGMVSGFYTYAVDYNYPRMCEQPEAMNYYDSLYNHHNNTPMAKAGRIDDNIVRYRTYAENRALRGINSPWIPFVQNHSNLFERDVAASGQWWDFDNLREPNAAELRLMCNIALAHGADGVMFYQYNTHGGTIIGADSACWPRLRSDWIADSTRPVNINAGAMGFLGANNLPRVCDTNGENKWDSTKAFIAGFLRPVGNRLMDMTWKRSRSWYSGDGESQLVSTIISQKQDAPNPIDLSYETFVETAEFIDGSADYLFIINGRTHSEGQRHVTVKLALADDSESEWIVENLQSGDIWIVQPSDSPDTTSTANGFTDYFEPGGAALYRLTAVPTPREQLPDTLPGNLYVTPGATLTLNSANNHLISVGKGIYVEGTFIANGSIFGPTNELWMGIHARNDGSVYLQDCQVIGSSVVAGSGGNVTAVDTRIDDAPYAFCNLGGSLYSTRTTAPTCLYGYAWLEGSYSNFEEDNATVVYGAPTWNIGIDLHGSGFAILRKCSLTDFGRGIVARAGTVGTFYGQLGRNTVDAVSGVLATDSLGWIDFGASTTDDGSQNCFLLQDYTNGVHAWGDGNMGISAVGSHWEPMPVKLQGKVNADSALANCPAPFTGNMDVGSFSKNMAPPTGVSFRSGLIQAICDSNFVLAGQLIGQRVSTANRATLDLETVYTLRHALLLFPQLEELRDTIVLAFLLHPNIRFKLGAADLLADAARFADALDVLQAYSFEGASYLKKEALIRSALYRPFAYRGGYEDGLRALDTLASITGNDSTQLPLFALYPRLYCGLTIPIPANAVRKAEERSSFWDRILPDGIDVWPNYPNPFTDVTSFTFKLGEDMHLRLAVYDAMGREVAVVTDADYSRGVHSVVLRSGTLPSGLYFYRLTTPSGVIQRKMLLMR